MNYSIILSLFLLLSLTHAYSGGIHQVVSLLAEYQMPNSGFTSDGEVATLEATAQAIFLSSFFGQRDKIDVKSVEEFLKLSKNNDNGYANRVGGRSELSALLDALLTMNHLGLPTANNDLKTFIFSLWNADKGLFANSYSDAPSLKATANALKCLEQLNGLSKVDTESIKNVLNSLTQEKDGVKSFSDDLDENYYGIVTASLVGFEFGTVEQWAGYFLQRQIPRGDYAGAFASGQTTSPQITEAAISALHILDDYTKFNIMSKVDTESLYHYLESLPMNLAASASSFKTIARANLIDNILHTRVVYESPQDIYSTITDRITQGLQIKPKLSVRTPMGIPHAGLDVSVLITDSTGEKKTIKLPWDADSQFYSGVSEFYTAQTLGAVTFKFDVKWVVADLGSELQYSVVQEKTIGYKVRVESKAQLAGKEIAVGSDVGIGTEFDFKLTLETAKKKNLLSGDFIVDFNVKDSSGQVISTSSLDCRDNTEDIKFSYNLEKLNIPSGAVVFSFGIKEIGQKKYHTVQEVSYSLIIKMIATDIVFPGKNFQVGDTFTVSMTPAAFPDLSTVIPLTGGEGATVRKFNLDVISGEDIVKTVPGVSTVNAKGNLVYTFSLTVDSTFDALGKSTVQFRYVPSYGDAVVLENYDSEIGELFTELQELSYTVDSKPNIVEVTGSINSGELKYGNSVTLGFRVQDSISGNFLYPASAENNVFLRLLHKDGKGATVVGASQAASVVNKSGKPEFFFNWNVSPNVVKGSAVLELIAQTPNGPVALLGEDGQEWRKQVTIGGDVQISAETSSGEIDERTTVFTLQFTLSCDDVKLDNADLVAVVSRNGVQLLESVVAQGVEKGDYGLSWNLPNKQTETGTYQVSFYRQVDRQSSSGEPFFTTSLYHEKKVQERGIVPTQFLVLLLLLTTFSYISWRKSKIESTRK